MGKEAKQRVVLRIANRRNDYFTESHDFSVRETSVIEAVAYSGTNGSLNPYGRKYTPRGLMNLLTGQGISFEEILGHDKESPLEVKGRQYIIEPEVQLYLANYLKKEVERRKERQQASCQK